MQKERNGESKRWKRNEKTRMRLLEVKRRKSERGSERSEPEKEASFVNNGAARTISSCAQ